MRTKRHYWAIFLVVFIFMMIGVNSVALAANTYEPNENFGKIKYSTLMLLRATIFLLQVVKQQ